MIREPESERYQKPGAPKSRPKKDRLCNTGPRCSQSCHFMAVERFASQNMKHETWLLYLTGWWLLLACRTTCPPTPPAPSQLTSDRSPGAPTFSTATPRKFQTKVAFHRKFLSIFLINFCSAKGNGSIDLYFLVISVIYIPPNVLKKTHTGTYALGWVNLIDCKTRYGATAKNPLVLKCWIFKFIFVASLPEIT